MSFGASAPPVELEGDYSTWTKKWEWDPPEGFAPLYPYYLWAVFQGGYLYVHYKDASNDRRFAVIDLTDGSTKFLSASGEHYTEACFLNDIGYTLYNHLVMIEGGMSFSIRGKYLITGRDYPASPEVWKDGVKVWTFPSASDVVAGADYYYQAGIRYDGKYIVAVTNNDKLVCFEGS